MDAKQVQRELTRRKLYSMEIDGILGKNSRKGIDNALKEAGFWPEAQSWSDGRRQIAFEQLVYLDEGIEVGSIDGLVGEQTRYARSVYNARLAGDKTAETWRDNDKTPTKPAPKPATQWPLQRDCGTFYGTPGSGHVNLTLPRPFRIAWEPEKLVSKVSVHHRCHDAFRAIWFGAHELYGDERFRELRLDMYGGCYSNRKMRGGSNLSMHAYACAWDVDPDRNQLKWTAKHASLDDAPYLEFWRIVEAQGGISLGRLKDFDWMHFQFARL